MAFLVANALLSIHPPKGAQLIAVPQSTTRPMKQIHILAQQQGAHSGKFEHDSLKTHEVFVCFCKNYARRLF
jgi:hypothetical protein